MISGLSVVTILLAGLTLLLAWRTFRSQEAIKILTKHTDEVLTTTKALQETSFNGLHEVLRHVESLQKAMNERDLAWRQDRARWAVDALINALSRQAAALHGQWLGLSDKADPLEPVRMYESELSSIPNCPWKEKCQEVFATVRQQGDGARAHRESLLTGGLHQLQSQGPLSLYAECMKTIENMS